MNEVVFSQTNRVALITATACSIFPKTKLNTLNFCMALEFYASLRSHMFYHRLHECV